MKTPANQSIGSISKALILSISVLVIIAAALWAWLRPAAQPSQSPAAQAVAQVQPAAAAMKMPAPLTTITVTNLPAAKTGILPNYLDFQSRPFPSAYESTNFQWTLADGKDTNVIRQLAHNPLEYARMVDENSRIFKRQLVYLKETAAAVYEQSKLTGEPVKQLALPGVDGQELQFQIVKSEANSSRQGMFSGHLAGNNDSLVTLAYQDGREAFTILSPKENIFVVGEPREDGQVVVKAIDPNTYGVGPAEKVDAVKTGSTK